MYQELAAELNAAPIQHIGKLLVFWRPIPPKERTVDEDRMPGPRDEGAQIQQTWRPAP